MTFLFIELLKHRIFGAANEFIDRRIDALPFILHPVSFFLKNPVSVLFVGLVIILVIHAYFDTRPKVKPRLKIAHYNQPMGLSDLQPDASGFGIAVTNDETRFNVTANNVRAKITFLHFLGNRLVADTGAWITGQPRHYSECVSIPMGEGAQLMLVIWGLWDRQRYYAAAPIPPSLDDGRKMEFGEWDIEIELTGDNVKVEFEGKLSLNANGSVDLTIRK